MSNDNKKIILLKMLSPASFIKIQDLTFDNNEKTIYELFNDFKLSLNNIDFLPIGSIIIYSGQYIPTNWLKCDGLQLLVNDYIDLYNIIGNLYGGDTFNFNLPDLRGKTIIGINDKYYLGQTGGEEVHVLTIDELPSHNFEGTTNISGIHNHNENTSLNGDHVHKLNSDISDYGLIHKSNGDNNTVNNLSLTNGLNLPDLLKKPMQLDINNSGLHYHTINDDGAHNHTFVTNTIGVNKAHNIMQPYIIMNYIIKYK
jgi:microcystin-dependent protein